MRVKDAYERKLLQEEVLPVQKEPRLKRQLWIWRTGLGSCQSVGPAALALALLFVALQATSRLLLRVGRRGKGVAVQEQLCKALAAGRYLLPYARYRTWHKKKKSLIFKSSAQCELTIAAQSSRVPKSRAASCFVDGKRERRAQRTHANHRDEFFLCWACRKSLARVLVITWEVQLIKINQSTNHLLLFLRPHFIQIWWKDMNNACNKNTFIQLHPFPPHSSPFQNIIWL